MRVLLVNYRYFVSGGPEKYMFNIKRVLEEAGHEVIPFSVHSNKNIETEFSKYFVEPIGGRDAVYYEDCKKTPKVIFQMLSRSIYSLEVKRATKRIIQATKPDITYVIHYVNKLSPSVIRASKQMKVPVVLRLSDYYLLCPRFDFLYDKKICEDCIIDGYKSCIKKRCVKGSLFASLVRVFSMKVHKWIRIYDDISAFVTPSQFLKMKLIESGIDESKIVCIPTFTNKESKEKISGFVGEYGLYFGRIVEEKGVETLVRAYEGLGDRYKLIVMGDDSTDEAKRLIKYVFKKKINNVKFVGFKAGEELERIIRESRYIFIPSIWYDNLPNTALEAFVYAKPVIASRIGSLPELVVDGINGYLFNPGDIDELIKCIEKLNNDEHVKTMGTESSKFLLQKFSQRQHYSALLDVFNISKSN